MTEKNELMLYLDYKNANDEEEMSEKVGNHKEERVREEEKAKGEDVVQSEEKNMAEDQNLDKLLEKDMEDQNLQEQDLKK